MMVHGGGDYQDERTNREDAKNTKEIGNSIFGNRE
jgi:hypothetical protein